VDFIGEATGEMLVYLVLELPGPVKFSLVGNLKPTGFAEIGGGILIWLPTAGDCFPPDPMPSYRCTMFDIDVLLEADIVLKPCGDSRPGDGNPLSIMDFDVGKMSIDCGRDRDDGGGPDEVDFCNGGGLNALGALDCFQFLFASLDLDRICDFCGVEGDDVGICGGEDDRGSPVSGEAAAITVEDGRITERRFCSFEGILSFSLSFMVDPPQRSTRS
jgi:hypothetical protein